MILRSISIAHKGFAVFELGYNLPDYEQKNFFSHNMATPYDLDYIRRSIKKLLAHPKVYGDRVAVVGQSLGRIVLRLCLKLKIYLKFFRINSSGCYGILNA